jgi:hypothetical protein
MSALDGFVGGLQQGYTFVENVKSRHADEARRDREDARRDKDAAFQEEERGRTRTNWKKDDEYKDQVANLNKEFFPPAPKTAPAPLLGIPTPAAQAAPADDQAVGTPASADPAQVIAAPAPVDAPVAAPVDAPVDAPAAPASIMSAPSAPQGLPKATPAPASAVPAPAGMPVQPSQPTSMGQSMDYLIRRAQIDLQHGKIDGVGLASIYKLRDATEKEGISDSIQLLANGDNEGAMRRFNQNGDLKDWTVQSSVDGIFKHGGADLPTKIVTLKAADGTTRTINTEQYRVQNQTIEHLVTQAQKAVEMDDQRTDRKETRKIQQQNADTQEGYRRDQATNMREQRRLQAAGGLVAAPIWGKDDDTFLKDQYSSKDETTGAKTFDGEGLQFAKAVAVARSRYNGGDAATASGYALAADANLKRQAGGDPAKLRQLRQEALQRLASAAPSARTASSGAPSAAGAPAAAPEPVPPRAAPGFTVGGMPIAERDQRIATFNEAVGGASSARDAAMAGRQADVANNFDTKLATIRPNMPRAEAQQLAEWFNEQSEAGTLSNQQLKQLREARRAAGM